MSTTAAPTSTTAVDEASLMKHTLPTLKKMAAAANTPQTGSKAALVQRLLDPAAHQRKRRAAPKDGIKKRAPKAAAPKKRAPHYLDSAYSGFSLGGFGGGYNGFGSDDEEVEHCEMCGIGSGDIDPHNGLCFECADKIRPSGGCPCWRMTCGFDPEEGVYDCEM